MPTYLVVFHPSESIYPSVNAEKKGVRFIGEHPYYHHAEFEAKDDKTARAVVQEEFVSVRKGPILCRKID